MLNLLTSLQGKSKKSSNSLPNPSKHLTQTTSQPIYLKRQYSKPLPKSPPNKHTTVSAYYTSNYQNNQNHQSHQEYKHINYNANQQNAYHHTGHYTHTPLPEPKQRNTAPVIPPLYFEQEPVYPNLQRSNNYSEVNPPPRSKSMYFATNTTTTIDNHYTSPPLTHKLPSQSHSRQNSANTDLYSPSHHSSSSITSIQPQPNQKIFPSHQNQHTPLSMYPNRNFINNSKSPLLNKKLSQYKGIMDEPHSRPLPKPIVRHDSAPTRQPINPVEPQRSKSTSTQNNLPTNPNSKPLSSMKSFAQLQQNPVPDEAPNPTPFKSFHQLRKEKLSMPDLRDVGSYESSSIKNRPLPKTPKKPNVEKVINSISNNDSIDDSSNSLGQMISQKDQLETDPWFKKFALDGKDSSDLGQYNPSQASSYVGENMSRESSKQSSILAPSIQESISGISTKLLENQKANSYFVNKVSIPDEASNDNQSTIITANNSRLPSFPAPREINLTPSKSLPPSSSIPTSANIHIASRKIQPKESVNELRNKFESKIEEANQPQTSQQLPNTVKELLRRPKTMFLPRAPVDISDGMPSIAATLDPEGSMVKSLNLENFSSASNKIDPEKLEEIKTTEMMISKLTRSKSNSGIAKSPIQRRNHWPVKDENAVKSPEIGRSIASPKWKSFSNLARDASDNTTKQLNTYNTIQSPEISPKPKSKINKLFRRSSLWSPKSERADSPPTLHSSSSETNDISFHLELTKLRSQLEKTQTELRNERQLHSTTHETYENKTKMLEDLHHKDLQDLKAVCSKQCRDLVQSIKELEKANRNMRQNMVKHGIEVSTSTPKISGVEGLTTPSLNLSSSGSQLSSLSDSKISIHSDGQNSGKSDEFMDDSDNLATYAFIEQQYRQIMGNAHPDFNKLPKSSENEGSPIFMRMESTSTNSNSSSPETRTMKLNLNANSIVSSRRGSLGASPALSYARRMSIVNSINSLNSSISPSASNPEKSNNLKSKSRLLAPSLLQVTPKMSAMHLGHSSSSTNLPMSLPNNSVNSVDMAQSMNNVPPNQYHSIKQVIPAPEELDIEPPLTFHPLKTNTSGNLWNSRSLKEKMLPELPIQ